MADSDSNKFDRTSSNKAGVTLMNNQVGHVVADVMRGHDNVKVEELPSMIRIDGDRHSSTSTSRRSPRRSAGPTSATTTSRRSCPPTTAAWSSRTTG